MYKKESFGVTPAGEQVERYTLINQKGTSASFLNLGAIWTAMLTPDRNGRLEDVVLGHDTVTACLNNSGHLGEVVGRYANRIAGAGFELNGVAYRLSANKGTVSLHSGPDFYRNRIWEAQVIEKETENTVSFALLSPDGDQGYPGNAKITVSYTLTDADELKIEYYLICDQDTVANFTNHSYFNLAGHKSGNAMKQQVRICAGFFTPVDEDSIPTGEVVSVKGTPFDFTQMKPIERDLEVQDRQLEIGSGFDHNWVLNHRFGEIGLAAEAFDEESGRLMEVYTDQPGVQFYTANHLEQEYKGKDQAVYESRCAYCFETQNYPNAVNTPHFPTPIVREGREHRTTTIFKFSVRK